MDPQRIQRMRRAMRRAGYDAVIFQLPENLVMSFGVWPMNGFSFGLFTAEAGPLALIAPSCEDQEMDGCWADEIRWFVWPRLDMEDPHDVIRLQISQLVKKHRLGRATIGYEGSFSSVAPSHNAGEVIVPSQASFGFLQSIIPAAKWSDATGWIHSQRATKTLREVERLRIAHRVASYGLKWFAGAVTPGQSETELAAGVYRECLVRGMKLKDAQHINVYPQISSGPNAHRAWRPVVTTGSRRLRESEMALLELAVCVDGFWADVTRVKAAGRATSQQRDAFAAVKAAQQAALNVMRPGVSFSKPHAAACNVLCQHGFAEQIVHITGHGLGFRYHEPEPMLMPDASGRLKTGHVCSVEPGLYDRSWGGIRLEDNIVVTTDAVEVLTKAAKRI